MSTSTTFLHEHPDIDLALKQAGNHKSAHSYEAALKEFTKAIGLIHQQRKLDRTLQITKGRCYLQMGRIHLEQERHDVAITELSHAAGIFETLHQPLELSGVLDTMGDVELGRGNFEEAKDFFRQATTTLQNANSIPQSGVSMVRWAWALAEVGEENQALKRLAEGVSRASRLDDQAVYSKVLGQAADVCRALGKTDNLIDYLERQVIIQQVLLTESEQENGLSNAQPLVSQSDQEWQQKLDELTEEKTEELRKFTRKAAHDMKEPLRMISSFGGLLKRQYSETLGEGGNEYIDIIMDANERMQALLIKLLEYVKVGTLERAPEQLDMEDVVLLASNVMKKQIESRNAVIQTGKLPKITAHREYMVQMLSRIIDNAILYNTSSKPLIRVDSETRTHETLLTVSDNGVGIEKEDWNKVFDLFLRLHGRDEYPGSGIGLATSMKIAEYYNGRMWVESIPGKGSTFFISIPKA
ncbi:MAG: signal transduction histidine kinase [Limisphaerales bacterium]|jgi:signal transduction histidine kinase